MYPRRNLILVIILSVITIGILAGLYAYSLTRTATNVQATMGEYSIRLDSGRTKDSHIAPGIVLTFLATKTNDKNFAVNDARSETGQSGDTITVTIFPIVSKAKPPLECGPTALCAPPNYVSMFIPLNEYLTKDEDFVKTLTIHVDGESLEYKLVGENKLLRLFMPNGDEYRSSIEVSYP